MNKPKLPEKLEALLLRAADQAYPNCFVDGSLDPLHSARLSKLREGAEIAQAFFSVENQKLRRIVRNANEGLSLFAQESGDEDDEYKDWFEDAKEFLGPEVSNTGTNEPLEGTVHPDEACKPPTECTNEICRMQRALMCGPDQGESCALETISLERKRPCCTCDGCCDDEGFQCRHQYCVEHTI